MLRERSLAQSGPPLLCCEKCKKKSPKRFTLARKNVIVYVMAMSSAQTEDGEMTACWQFSQIADA